LAPHHISIQQHDSQKTLMFFSIGHSNNEFKKQLSFMQEVSLEKIFTDPETPQKHTHYKGVCWNKKASKWQAYVYASGKRYYAGYFLNELDAAHAVNAQCDELEIPRRNPDIGDPPSNVIKTTKRIKHARREAMILSGLVYPQQLVHNPSNLIPIPPTAALNHEVDSGSQQLIPDKDALVCRSCQRMFDNSDSYWRHQAIHGKIVALDKKSPESFPKEREYPLKHVPSDFPGRYQCDQCPRSFTSKGGLSRHKNVHWKNKEEAKRSEPPMARRVRLRFACPRCDAPFESTEDLNWHTNLAHGTITSKHELYKKRKLQYELSYTHNSYSKRRRLDERKKQETKQERGGSPSAGGNAFDIASLFLQANETIIKREYASPGLMRQALEGHNVAPDDARIRLFQKAVREKKRYNYRQTEPKSINATEMDFESQVFSHDDVAYFEETL